MGFGTEALESASLLASSFPTSPLWVTACLGILATGAAVAPLDAQQNEPEQARLIKMTDVAFSWAIVKFPGWVPRFGIVPLITPLFAGFPILYALSPAVRGRSSRRGPPLNLARSSDLALILLTPGTTGASKAVPLSHANIMPNLSALAAAGLAGPLERALIPCRCIIFIHSWLACSFR